jgi:hypothetical protein
MNTNDILTVILVIISLFFIWEIIQYRGSIKKSNTIIEQQNDWADTRNEVLGALEKQKAECMKLENDLRNESRLHKNDIEFLNEERSRLRGTTTESKIKFLMANNKNKAKKK